MFWFWLAATLTLDLIGMVLGKQFHSEKDWWLLVLAILSFAAMGYTMTQMMAFRDLAIVNILWSVSISAILIAVGYFWFSEKLTLLQIMGIVVCLFGVTLIQWPTK